MRLNSMDFISSCRSMFYNLDHMEAIENSLNLKGVVKTVP